MQCCCECCPTGFAAGAVRKAAHLRSECFTLEPPPPTPHPRLGCCAGMVIVLVPLRREFVEDAMPTARSSSSSSGCQTAGAPRSMSAVVAPAAALVVAPGCKTAEMQSARKSRLTASSRHMRRATSRRPRCPRGVGCEEVGPGGIGECQLERPVRGGDKGGRATTPSAALVCRSAKMQSEGSSAPAGLRKGCESTTSALGPVATTTTAPAPPTLTHTHTLTSHKPPTKHLIVSSG